MTPGNSIRPFTKGRLRVLGAISALLALAGCGGGGSGDSGPANSSASSSSPAGSLTPQTAPALAVAWHPNYQSAGTTPSQNYAQAVDRHNQLGAAINEQN